MSVKTEQELIQELLIAVMMIIEELDAHRVKPEEMNQLNALIAKWSDSHPEITGMLQQAIDRNQKSLN